MDHDDCSAGVAFDTLKGIPFNERPCFKRNGIVCGGCDLQTFPTDEEVAEQDREFEKRFQRTGIARQAIVDYLGGPWKHGMEGSVGGIECPICKGSLAFQRSGYNGHIHASCSTEGCVSWMQ